MQGSLLQEKLHNAMVPCQINEYNMLRALPKQSVMAHHCLNELQSVKARLQSRHVLDLAKKRLLKEDRGSWEDFTYRELSYLSACKTSLVVQND